MDQASKHFDFIIYADDTTVNYTYIFNNAKDVNTI